MRVSRTKRHAGRETYPDLPIDGPSPLDDGSPETVSEKLGSGEGVEKERQGKAKPSKEAADLSFLAGCCFTRL